MPQKAFSLVTWLFVAAIVAAKPCFAEGASEIFAAGDIGLVQPLSWGVNSSQAMEALPGLQLTPDLIAESDLRVSMRGSASATHSGCLFQFDLRFFKDRLDEMHVRSQNTEICHEAIEPKLLERYHDSNVPAACPNLIRRRWPLAGTIATYRYDCLSSSESLTLDLVETTDLSGRIDDAERNKYCQQVVVELLPARGFGFQSGPALAPYLPEFGCSDYPPISARLQEQGAVLINVRIGENGRVASAELATSSGKARLDNAALVLAQQKLKFTPAIQDGKPVESLGDLKVTYHLLHLIRGHADVAYRCYDGGQSLFLPCFGAFPGLAAAPARNGASLKVTSSDIRSGAALPARLTFAGRNESPALDWTAGPLETQSYVLIAEDAGLGPPSRDPAVSWIVLNIPTNASGVPNGIPGDLKIANPRGAINAQIYNGYIGRPVHFQIFALDTLLMLDPLRLDRAAVISAMQNHVLASGELIAGNLPTEGNGIGP